MKTEKPTLQVNLKPSEHGLLLSMVSNYYDKNFPYFDTDQKMYFDDLLFRLETADK